MPTICPLCRLREGTVKNTHYLTDSIIRPCINLDGSNDREKGVYFNMSQKGYVEMNFQRGTNMVELEKELKRLPTDEEIARAKKNPYAVDEVFCKECERLFGDIETKFASDILPKFRGVDLSKVDSVVEEDVKLARLFWYIQVWRSGVCAPQNNLPDSVLETLRALILKHDTVTVSELTTYPMSITYLVTKGEPTNMTKNFVGFVSQPNWFIVFMCDFVIQFFPSAGDLTYNEYFGLNESDASDFINLNEQKFKAKVFQDEKRRQFLENFRTEDARERLQQYAAGLNKIWMMFFNKPASKEIVQEYIDKLTDNPDESILHWSQENVLMMTWEFIQQKAGSGNV